MRCPRCTQLVAQVAHECPYCHEQLNIHNVIEKPHAGRVTSKDDYQNNKLTYLCAVIPLLGLIYYLMNKDILPLRSLSAIRGFKYNCIIVVIIVLYLLIAL